VFGWLLGRLGLCRHRTMLRERVLGIPCYVCASCGYAVPVLKRVK
jgi:hypothetical protein